MKIRKEFTFGHVEFGVSSGHPGEVLSTRLAHSFPIPAVTNSHKRSCLKHHRFIILQFRRSEILKSRCRQNHVPFGGSRRECVSLPFPGRGAACFLAPGPSL